VAVDASGLRDAVERWAEEVHRRAVDDLLDEVDAAVPRGSGDRAGGGQRLADTREVRDASSGSRAVASVAYTAEHASFTDEGTDPHPILGDPLLAFEWNGRLVIVRSVRHPGTEGTAWWSSRVDDQGWERALSGAAEGVDL